jgi:hypothetical protein
MLGRADVRVIANAIGRLAPGNELELLSSRFTISGPQPSLDIGEATPKPAGAGHDQ